MPTITAGPGDSVPSIARKTGFFWETLWNRPENAELKAKRKNPNILFSGDEVFVPEKELKVEPVATEATHVFRRLGIPSKFRMQLMKFGEPRKNEPYILHVGTTIIEGETDGSGMLEEFLPKDAKSAKLIMNEGKEEYTLDICRLDPVTEVSGVKQRLNNLGYSCGAEDDELTPRTRAALEKFQRANGLPETGEADEATQGKLESLYA